MEKVTSYKLSVKLDKAFNFSREEKKFKSELFYSKKKNLIDGNKILACNDTSIKEYVNAYQIHELFDMLPLEIEYAGNKYMLKMMMYSAYYENETINEDYLFSITNRRSLVEALGDILLYLKKKDLLKNT